MPIAVLTGATGLTTCSLKRSSLQDKLCRILDVYQHVHGSLRNALSVYKPGPEE